MSGTPRAQLLFCSLPVFIFLLSCFPALAGKRPTAPTEFDRVAYAVEGAESSHGSNPAMWRTDPAGPQGPMQVSEKAAIDIGGGNRFDNRAEPHDGPGLSQLAAHAVWQLG